MDTPRSFGPLGFVWTPQRDGSDKRRLREVLEAHLRSEDAHRMRRLVSTIALLLSVLVWLCAVWPNGFGSDVRRFILTLFALSFGALVVAAFVEWRYRRRCLCLIGSHTLAPSQGAPDSGAVPGLGTPTTRSTEG